MLPNVPRLLWIWIFLFCVGGISTALGDDKTEPISERILSRKRRFLIFPTGSSYQLVYDSIITIPGWTYYAVTGVGSLPLLEHRKDGNVTEPNRKGETVVNSTPKYRDNNHSYYYIKSDFSNYINNRNSLSQNRRKSDSFHFAKEHSSTPFNNGFKIRPPFSSNYYNNSKHYDAFTNYMMTNYFKPWIESDAYKTNPTMTKKLTKKTTTEYKPVINKFHTVYPIFGKRSIPNSKASYTEKLYSNHHRRTRHSLYRIVEKYLFAKGFNGTECVMKTLYEVGEKSHEHEPGSFLGEIVRAIFSFPAAQLQHSIEKRHIEYDEAHNSDNCAVKYKHCPYSIWNAGFLLETDNLLPKFKK